MPDDTALRLLSTLIDEKARRGEKLTAQEARYDARAAGLSQRERAARWGWTHANVRTFDGGGEPDLEGRFAPHARTGVAQGNTEVAQETVEMSQDQPEVTQRSHGGNTAEAAPAPLSYSPTPPPTGAYPSQGDFDGFGAFLAVLESLPDPAANAGAFHAQVDAGFRTAGWLVGREAPVLERGDGRTGRVDLVAERHGYRVAVELDRAAPREKSLAKLAAVAVDLRAVLLRSGPEGMQAPPPGVDVVFGFGHTGNGRHFEPPSRVEVRAYAEGDGLPVEHVDEFCDHFDSNGWKVGGKTAMRDWRAAYRNWVKRAGRFGPRQKAAPAVDFLGDPRADLSAADAKALAAKYGLAPQDFYSVGKDWKNETLWRCKIERLLAVGAVKPEEVEA